MTEICPFAIDIFITPDLAATLKDVGTFADIIEVISAESKEFVATMVSILEITSGDRLLFSTLVNAISYAPTLILFDLTEVFVNAGVTSNRTSSPLISASNVPSIPFVAIVAYSVMNTVVPL